MAVLERLAALFSRSPEVSLSPLDRCDGRTALVTGANRGIGLAIATQLVARGGHVILACRSGIPDVMDRVRREAQVLARELGCGPAGTVDAVHLDLTRLGSVDSVAQELSHDGAVLDIVVLNAAMIAAAARRTDDGFDEMLQVNFLANVRLIGELRRRNVLGRPFSPEFDDPDVERVRPRIVVVTSVTHRVARPIDLAGLGKRTHYGAAASLAEYAYTKLLLETWAAELARRLDPDVAVHTACPGPVATDIARETPPWLRPLADPSVRRNLQSASEGARSMVWLATARPIEGRTGLHVQSMRLQARSPLADDATLGTALHDRVAELWPVHRRA